MTVQIKVNSSNHSKNNKKPFLYTYELKEMGLYFIAVQMKDAGLSEHFIVNAVKSALEYEGISDLMGLWLSEEDKNERDEIISDIQEMIEETSIQHEIAEENHISFNDLEKISKNIRSFKDSLYQEVMERGGISKLAESTGIPQPSLSRFFNSDSMPRRSTVLAIAKALNLDRLTIDLKWSKS